MEFDTVEAINLDAGGSTTMVIRNQLANNLLTRRANGRLAPDPYISAMVGWVAPAGTNVVTKARVCAIFWVQE